MLTMIILFLMCLLACTVNGALFMSIDSTTVGEGTTTKITCYGSVDDSNIFTTGGKIEWERTTMYSGGLQRVAEWTRTNNGDPFRLDERFDITGGLGSQTMIDQKLEIRNTSRTDQGAYSCVLYDGQGQQVAASRPLRLTVRYPPAEHFPDCTASPGVADKNVHLLCQSENTTPPVSVQWYRNGMKVADGHTLDPYAESRYSAAGDELDSSFECRLVYNDVDVSVDRSCTFSRPQVVILKTGEEVENERHWYHAFVHSSPTLVSDIQCFLHSSTGTPMVFETENSWYAAMRVGPVALADNGTDLVCRAKNVFGWGEARMKVYVYSDGTRRGETTLPSVVTNYIPNEGILTASIWPKYPLLSLGDNMTFGCSYSLATHSSSRARVDISWRYNDFIVDRSMPRFVTDSNSLEVRDITADDDGARVTCVVNVVGDGTSIVNLPGDESTTTIYVSDDTIMLPCTSDCLKNSTPLPYGETSIMRHPSFVIGLTVLAGIGWLAVIIIILLIITRKKQNRRSRNVQHNISSQMTYRANGSNAQNGHSRGMDHANDPSLRALPAEPSPSNRNGDLPTDSAGWPKANLHTVVPVESSKPELAYQEMVGNTGATMPRNGSAIKASGTVNDIGNAHPLIGASSPQPTLVPVPNGGFIPQGMLASNGDVSEKPSGQHDGEMNYEDLDCMRQRNGPRATGNDYQTSISNTPFRRPSEEQELLPHYANS